jgi:hypothetical protein
VNDNDGDTSLFSNPSPLLRSAFVEILSSSGPLRDGQSVADATDLVAEIANPENYAYLTRRRGWTAARVQRWLEESLTLLLLPPS